MSSTASSSAGAPMSRYLFNLVYLGIIFYIVAFIAKTAYKIRLHAIDEYGLVIHEFDPWFNFRATQYLYDNGPKKFFQWFDYMSWYPLGRPVGTTIYPGMQFTAVFLTRYLFRDKMSLNDVCCYMPAWFGAVASIITGLIAYECSRSDNAHTNVLSVLLDLIFPSRRKGRSAVLLPPKSFSPAVEVGVATAAIMAIVPAHLMRSVGGGYDNESVAITAMTLTFYFWVRSLRNSDVHSHWYGALAGVAYFNMAAAWGGYVFVLNMVACHAAALLFMGRLSRKIYISYSLFYIIGTGLAVQIPVVGWTPLKSLEQLGSAFVFALYQLLFLSDYLSSKRSKTGSCGRWEAWKMRLQVLGVGLIVAYVFIHFMAPAGYFGPLSARVRGLFVKHTRTGNPLVDSVAEHQPANSKAYFQYLHYVCSAAPLGWFMLLWNFGDAPSFLVLYGAVAYFFSAKMVRLIILLGPSASILGGVALGRIVSWSLQQYIPLMRAPEGKDADGSVGSAIRESNSSEETTNGTSDDAAGKGGSKKKKKAADKAQADAAKKTKKSSFGPVLEAARKASDSKEGRLIKKVIAASLIVLFYFPARTFNDYCWKMSGALSHPAIMFKAQTRDGQTVLVDDYREAYFWLRDNTPRNARVLAWWDYGYQITGIANRTTIADGNTWNHEHIALLGKILTTNEKDGHRIARHLADYALVWAGGGGDDLAKSPHLARIANSVYRDHCGNDDPTCRKFGFIDRQGTPSKMMEESFLYKLHSNGLKPGVTVDANRFKEVYTSRYRKVRIYKILGVSKESKDWAANNSNRLCDVEGGWFCRGQYPPALKNVLSQGKDFSQLEDFNKRKQNPEHHDEEYTKKYFEDLANPDKAKAQAIKKESKKSSTGSTTSKQDREREKNTPPPRRLTQDEIDEVSNNWEDTEETTLMWRLISENAVDDIREWIQQEPRVAFLRSGDGRGPMWWAYEFRNEDIVKMLIAAGVSYKDVDKNGKTPLDMSN